MSLSVTAIFPQCCSLLTSRQRDCFDDLLIEVLAGGSLSAEALAVMMAAKDLPPYLADLAWLEWCLHQLDCDRGPPDQAVGELSINPHLFLHRCRYRGLADFFGCSQPPAPRAGEEYVAGWLDSEGGRRIEPLDNRDLLALKIMAEGLDWREAAAETGVSPGYIAQVLFRARQRGILVSPSSKIRRDPGLFPPTGGPDDNYLASPVFTIQWHLTQTCDLRCRHCYDRSKRKDFELCDGIRLLDELFDFCRERHVHGQVTFTGGNPFLYPDFFALYQEAADRGFLTGILGNPVSRPTLEQLVAIQMPEFYQVSLEGMAAHNDYVRGPGHFERVITFLNLLRELGIYSMVMLTLTRDNQGQVAPLAERLRDRTDLFTFNRLALFGEGARLQMAPASSYREFLAKYEALMLENSAVGLKDNLFNILRKKEGKQVFGGCTGYGCGAAFNFVSILSDGEVHACRKFPSHLGNIHTQTLAAIYDSATARQYRSRPVACRKCPLCRVCGGCPAVVASLGGDPFSDRDPYCFQAKEQD
jgi:selenobiotic family peptide radical SAM maturase